MADGVKAGPDGKPRCWWALSTEDYVAYHDEEWGRPLHGERELFERLTLAAFQSGPSWLTILRKRQNFPTRLRRVRDREGRRVWRRRRREAARRRGHRPQPQEDRGGDHQRA